MLPASKVKKDNYIKAKEPNRSTAGYRFKETRDYWNILNKKQCANAVTTQNSTVDICKQKYFITQRNTISTQKHVPMIFKKYLNLLA